MEPRIGDRREGKEARAVLLGSTLGVLQLPVLASFAAAERRANLSNAREAA